jgi:multidrug efflux pump subunit AcrB
VKDIKIHNENIAGTLAKTFIKHPLTLILGVFILAVGYLSLVLTPREENPQIKVSGGAVIVPMPGAKASEIQKIVIEPLERKIREIKGVEHIYSYAQDSVGIVQVQYYIGQEKGDSDLKLYDQVMRNIDLLPKGAMPPLVKTMDIDTDIPVATIAFYAKNSSMNQTQLYQKINRIAKEINKIESVALVDLKGERKEQFNILVDANKLLAYNVTLGQVAKTLDGLTFKLPDVKGEKKDSQFVMFGVENGVESEIDIQNIIVDSYQGRAVLLKNIATITRGDDIQNKKVALLSSKVGDKYYFNQIPQTTMTISKLKGANTVVINHKIFDYLDSVKGQLEQDGICYVVTRDDGYTANHAVNELVMHLLISVVVIAVLLIFTLGFKEAIIVSLTVPMILSLTLFVGYLLGETINRITLFALLLSLGLLVDAAIIVIENIHRHLHEEQSANKDLEEISIEATNEVGNPTNIATIAIILTFVPMFFVGGMMGQFMHPLPVFVPISLFMSLFVAYIFTPYLVKKLLKKSH